MCKLANTFVASEEFMRRMIIDELSSNLSLILCVFEIDNDDSRISMRHYLQVIES
jgi:hypothetical protein